ncbi:MAG: hypothetical protein IPK16_12135 [Anaerolineales bacterium]|nr:hypothetical protein [Anaerolineales bacterium]
MKPERQRTRSKWDRIAGWAILLLAAATIAALSLATLALARTNQPASPVLTVAGLPPQLQLAVDNLSKAITLDPTRREAYTELATAYRLANRSEDAAAVWRMAAQANPQEAWPWLALAAQLEQQGDFEGQLNALVQAAALDDDDPALQAQITDLRQVIQSQRSARAAADAASLPSAQPLTFTPLAETLSNDWTLVGMLTSRAALRADENARAWFFWQAPVAGAVAGSLAQGWEQIDDFVWVHKTASTHNLVTAATLNGTRRLGSRSAFQGTFSTQIPAPGDCKQCSVTACQRRWQHCKMTRVTPTPALHRRRHRWSRARLCCFLELCAAQGGEERSAIVGSKMATTAQPNISCPAKTVGFGGK